MVGSVNFFKSYGKTVQPEEEYLKAGSLIASFI
jgi:hypothetical protein